jgi:hypothetical protein
MTIDIEKRKEKSKRYYQRHKDERRQHMKEKTPCPICEKMISRRNLSRHRNFCELINSSSAELFNKYVNRE